MYAIIYNRPDIAHTVGVVSRFLTNHENEHREVVKWILRYVRGTSKVCMCFDSGELMLDGYTNLDMTGDVDSKKSISCFLMTFVRGVIS